MKWFEDIFSKWVVRRRWWIIVVTVALFLISGSGVTHLTFDNDLRIFFSKENPQLRALEELENTYNRIDNVFFVIAPKNGDVFTRETLQALEELTGASWKVPYSVRVDSITNFQYTRAEEDDLIVEDLVRNSGSLSDADLREIRDVALAEPVLVNRLISSSGAVTAVNINILLPEEGTGEVPEVAHYVRQMGNDIRDSYPGIDLYLTGGIMFDNAFGEATEDDMSTLIPLMFIMILLIIGFTLRSMSGTFSTLFIIVTSMVTGLGMAGWAGIALNPASASAPTIILVLAVADSVHILSTIIQQSRLGKSKHDAIIESLRINLQPVFLTSATTAIGFLTMNFSDAPPFRDLGNIVATGVMAAFVYSVTLLPALMAVLPSMGRKRSSRPCPACSWIADFVIRRRRAVFAVMLAVILALSSGVTLIELNDEWLKYFEESYDIRTATDFTQKHLSGFDVIEYSLDSGEEGGINSPDYLKKVEDFANWYRKQPSVAHVSVITDTIKRLNKNMNGNNDTFYTIPDRRELAAQYLLLYEMSLPFGLDLNNRINVDKSATRMIVTIKGLKTSKLRELDRSAREWLEANASKSMFTYGSGLSIIWAHISERNINSMLGASIVALVLISGILIMALRSVRIGIVSLVPNLAPALMAFGIWGILFQQVGLGLSVVVAMTLGIVVDDTVHFISKYLRARREYGKDPEEAVRYAFQTVGTAMWVTTLSLVTGFLVLTFSGYRMNADMGLLSAITITLALVLDFFFLPTLLMKVDRTEL